MNGDAHSYIRSSEPCSASPRVSASMGHNHPPRQPVPVPHRPFCETFLPYIQSKSTLGFCTTSQIVPGSKQAIVSISTCSTQRGRKKKKERKKEKMHSSYCTLACICQYFGVHWRCCLKERLIPTDRPQDKQGSEQAHGSSSGISQ